MERGSPSWGHEGDPPSADDASASEDDDRSQSRTTASSPIIMINGMDVDDSWLDMYGELMDPEDMFDDDFDEDWDLDEEDDDEEEIDPEEGEAPILEEASSQEGGEWVQSQVALHRATRRRHFYDEVIVVSVSLMHSLPIYIVCRFTWLAAPGAHPNLHPSPPVHCR
jgi:hypothetical protein